MASGKKKTNRGVRVPIFKRGAENSGPSLWQQGEWVWKGRKL